ncbi:hypothetical protein E5288_WYG014889 [Bos mutus]|uniref:Uncharacterized protein n=1 Tax=Bos mutus TaxID=72004 RepID=A0A6B0S4K0_9CETA|nr:hypothetical protein [Bos mutus]
MSCDYGNSGPSNTSAGWKRKKRLERDDRPFFFSLHHATFSNRHSNFELGLKLMKEPPARRSAAEIRAWR